MQLWPSPSSALANQINTHWCILMLRQADQNDAGPIGEIEAIDLAGLRAATGFDLGDLSNVPPTPEPSEEELHLLREVVDPRRHLLPDIDQD